MTRHPPPTTHPSSSHPPPPPLLPPRGCRLRTSSPSTRTRCAFSLGYQAGCVGSQAGCIGSQPLPPAVAASATHGCRRAPSTRAWPTCSWSRRRRTTTCLRSRRRPCSLTTPSASSPRCGRRRHLPPSPAHLPPSPAISRHLAPPRATRTTPRDTPRHPPRHPAPPRATPRHLPPPFSTFLYPPPQAPGLKDDSDARAWANWRQRVARFLYWAVDGGLHPGAMTLDPKPLSLSLNHDPDPDPSPKPHPRPNPGPNQAR